MDLRSIYCLFSLLLSLIYVQNANGSDYIQTIRAQVRDFMENSSIYEASNTDLVINVGELDSRLKLRKCGQPLVLSRKGSKGQHRQLLIKVKCHSPTPWSIYVPVRINRFVNVLVSTRSLSRGHQISKADVQVRKLDTEFLSGAYLTEPEQAIGLVPRRTIAADKVLNDRQLDVPKVIKRGDDVFISANHGSIAVQMVAIALSDGKTGQRINVRNKQSRKIVRATVLGPGRVAAAM